MENRLTSDCVCSGLFFIFIFFLLLQPTVVFADVLVLQQTYSIKDEQSLSK